MVTDQCPTRPKYASRSDPWDRSVICGAALEAWHSLWGVVRLLWETPAEQTSPPDQDRAPGVDSNPYPYVLIGAKMATQIQSHEKRFILRKSVLIVMLFKPGDSSFRLRDGG